MHIADFICQPWRGEHLELVAIAQEVAAEIGGRAQIQFEIGVVLAFLPFPLTLVDRQVSYVEPFISIGADDDSLGLRVIADKDPVAFLEIGLRIKIGIHLELDVRDGQVQDAVKGEHPEVVGGWLLCSRVPVEMSQDVPPLLEQLDTIGFKVQVVGLFRAVLPVVHLHPHAFLHRVDDHFQMVP